jgi:hypothetical protein
VHLDVRADNILLGPAGQCWLVDWPWAVRGAPWLDSAGVLLEAAIQGVATESIVDTTPLLSTVDPALVTGFVAGMASMWAYAARQPDPPGLPTLRAYQRGCHRAALRWLRSRLG